MKWITSDGGPFICVARRSGESWKGASGLSLPIDEAAFAGFGRSRLGPFGHTDYGWACLCDDYAMVLPGGLDDALIVGDLPDPLIWHPLGETVGLFVKWFGADSDEQVAAHLPEVARVACAAPVTVFEISGELAVFDAAYMLSETGDNQLSIHLKPGRYAVSPGRYVATDIELHLLKFELERSSQLAIFRRGDETVLRETSTGLASAFESLADLPEDFMADGRNDTPPQSRSDS